MKVEGENEKAHVFCCQLHEKNKKKALRAFMLKNLLGGPGYLRREIRQGGAVRALKKEK